jgi:hypothetical protein
MLWITWFDLVSKLKSAFSREKTFFWAVFILMSFSVKREFAGITSFVREMKIDPKFYTKILHFFHSDAVNLEKLTQLWVQVCLNVLDKFIEMVNGKIIIIGDGIKVAKEGRKMPGVKLLHQESQNNNKAEYIMGHSIQVLSLLAKSSNSHVAVPLAGRIHEGFKTCNRYKKTLLDKILELTKKLQLGINFYLVADAYYASKKMMRELVSKGNHLISRVKTNAVAYAPCAPTAGKRKAGRPKKYGKKIVLKNIFKEEKKFKTIDSPIYQEKSTKIKYHEENLLMRGMDFLVKYVFVIHPVRGKIILISTDLTLPAIKIIHIYGLRFKIEVGFKSSVHVIGAFCYRFWMKAMQKIKRRDGDQFLHRKEESYREKFFKKLQTYQLHIQMGLIAQGLMMCLAIIQTNSVWENFKGWMRTMRPGTPPSEMIVGNALREGIPEFFNSSFCEEKFKKFLLPKLKMETSNVHRMTG